MPKEGTTHIVKYEFRNDEPDITHGRGYAYNLNYHIVWCTKYRNQALANPIVVDSLKDKILQICHENEYTVKALEIMPTHVHILLSAKPKESVTNIVKKLKGITAKWLFEKYPETMKEYFWGGHRAITQDALERQPKLPSRNTLRRNGIDRFTKR